MLSRPRLLSFGLAILLSAPAAAVAEVPVQRTFFKLASSNGHGAVLLDLAQARLSHFREHLFATEEPLIDALGADVWTGAGFGSVDTRDLLYDAYFGVRVAGDQSWLTTIPVDLDASGYAGWKAGEVGGTGVATMHQSAGALAMTQYFFAPEALGHAGFVMVMRVKNTGATTLPAISAFSLHNFHMGFGRPGVSSEIGEEGETIDFDGSGGKADLLERAFAGVLVARALAPVARHGASSALSPAGANVYQIVADGGTADLPDLNGPGVTGDASISAFQFDLGDLAAGEEQWVGVAFTHHGDPFLGATAQAWLDAYVAGKGAQALVDDEIAQWAAFQAQIAVPAGLAEDEARLLRQSAVMLRMAQSQEDASFLREHLSMDGEVRRTRFGATLGGPPATLPATVAHRGKGAVIASLPPGQWTYAWIRDGAYAAAAMAELGMATEARDALAYYLDAEAGRFQAWTELSAYAMPPYQMSLVRYHGFGVEETDFNGFGPNLEFDGFGLFLWALRRYELATGDTSLTDASYAVVSTKVADVLTALIDPTTGLIRKDSSIWESHWNGRERAWAYTSITAARGLCDAADMAERVGDRDGATKYRAAGQALRAAIATKLTDASGAIASTTEELAAGQGYWDAAVLDAVAMGLFDPAGKIAKATLAGIDANLATPAGAGWSRNDDNHDHAGGSDVSPWGSSYDDAEWVVTDLRGAVATRLAGDTERSDRLIAWVREQSIANYMAVAETYDENSGTYKFNAPMVGFGAGVYALAILQREGSSIVEPACGAYHVEGGGGGGGGAGGEGAGGEGPGAGGGATTTTASATSTGAGAFTTGAGGSSDAPAEDDTGCGCRVGPAGTHGRGVALFAAALVGLAAARRRARNER